MPPHAAGFGIDHGRGGDLQQRRRSVAQAFGALNVEALQEKLRRKDEVLSELMEEHVKLKKELGEL